MKSVSFILPCYNVGRYITDCLDSIYAQDMPEEQYEVICVNDCSTDNTRDVILSYAGSHSNLQLIDHQQNLTVGGARNTGLGQAKGEYIWFVDADDAIKPDCLQGLYAKAEETGVDVLFFNFDDADETLKVKREDRAYPDSEVCSGQAYIEKYFRKRLSVFGIIWRAWFKTEFLRENDLQFPLMRASEDVAFLWKVMLTAGSVCSVSKACYIYRNNPYSITKHRTLAKVAFSDRILRADEIVRMMNGREILPSIAEDMLRDVRWCANSNMELVSRMSKEERGRYYAEIVGHRDAVATVRPFMNRKHRLLFDTSLGKQGWLLKAGLMCRFEQRKHR